MIYKHIAVAAILVGSTIVDLYKQNRKLRKQNDALYLIANRYIKYATYQAELLERNNVEVTAFDLIVINDLATFPEVEES